LAQLGPFWPVLSLGSANLGRVGPSQAVLGHLPLFGSTVGLFQNHYSTRKVSFWTNSGQFRPIQTISGHFRPFRPVFSQERVVSDQLEPVVGCFGLTLGHYRSFWVVSDRFWPFHTPKGQKRNVLEASDCFGSLGRTVSGRPKAIKGHLRAVSDYFRPFRARKVPRVIWALFGKERIVSDCFRPF